MQIIYHLSIYLYYFIVFLFSFFTAKGKLWINGRKDFRKEITKYNFRDAQWIWFHCSSLGEFNDGRTLIDAIKERYPHYKIILTFFSPSGYENKKNYPNADLVLYLPLDTKSNSRFFIQTINPCLAFFIRNDIWYNYLNELNNRNIPAFLVSFTLNSKSKFLKFPLKQLYKKAFQNFQAIFVQDEQSKIIMDKVLLNNSTINAGNLRADIVSGIAETYYKNSFIEKFIDGKFCIIAGSSHKKDKDVFIETYLRMKNKNIKWIIVPHEINSSEIVNVKKILHNYMILLSESDTINSPTLPDILWVNEVGILSKIYRYADIVFIGGGFGKSGIHSILEPAVYGCPVCFGPNHREYPEAIYLINSGGAEIISDSNELEKFILKYSQNKNLLLEINQKNKTYLNENTGATINVLNYLQQYNFIK